ncbi:MAG TPA: alpha/beta hydrolase [Pyrinomonadaceae bacterium]|nr:alpha/beta hydrolase [Pyrinomonadaceae bacterium]
MNETQRKHFIKRFFKNLWSSKRLSWISFRILLLLIVCLIAFVMLFENRFIFFPSKYPEGNWEVENLKGREGEMLPKIENVWLETPDGVRIHGWYSTPQRIINGQASTISTQMALLWFHGNAGNITDRYGVISNLMELPVAVFIIDYRGYGRSEGSPSEQGVYTDARTAWDYLTGTRNISPKNIVIFGDSLGGAVAIDLATKVDAAGLIVQSTFTSISDMAAQLMPAFPRFLLRTKMDSINKIESVSYPKLFIHSPSDEMIPFSMGRKLYDAAREPKQFYEVAGASHNSTDLVGGRAYYEAIGNFIKKCAPAS